MKIGVSVPPVTGSPVDVAVMARRAEDLGFESIWVPEHPIMPLKSISLYSPTGGTDIPDSYSNMVDPFVALAQASAVASTLRLATGVCLVPERNPLLLAKVISTLDYFSGGRFVFGIGAGWHREESEIMGGDFDHRWTQTREAVLAMKEIWTKDEAEFHGRYYDFPRCDPTPSRPRNPTLRSCWAGPPATCCSGWLPGETAGFPRGWPPRRSRPAGPSWTSWLWWSAATPGPSRLRSMPCVPTRR